MPLGCLALLQSSVVGANMHLHIVFQREAHVCTQREGKKGGSAHCRPPMIDYRPEIYVENFARIAFARRYTKLLLRIDC